MKQFHTKTFATIQGRLTNNLGRPIGYPLPGQNGLPEIRGTLFMLFTHNGQTTITIIEFKSHTAHNGTTSSHPHKFHGKTYGSEISSTV